MSDAFTRYVAVVLLLVQAVASLGRGESLCIPLERCGEAAAAHHHHHHDHLDGPVRRSFVAHRHVGERRFAAEQAPHACEHDHHRHGDHGHAAGSHGHGPIEDPCDHRGCCGEHLHLDLTGHELPPRSGCVADLPVLANDRPAAALAAIGIGAEIVPREATVGQSWIRSDQRRTIDVASIVV